MAPRDRPAEPGWYADVGAAAFIVNRHLRRANGAQPLRRHAGAAQDPFRLQKCRTPYHTGQITQPVHPGLKQQRNIKQDNAGTGTVLL